jgi:hypothetical protein
MREPNSITAGKEEAPGAHYCAPGAYMLGDKSYLPILNILVPHEGHVPCVAGRPFFMVMAFGSFISFLALHFTQ